MARWKASSLIHIIYESFSILRAEYWLQRSFMAKIDRKRKGLQGRRERQTKYASRGATTDDDWRESRLEMLWNSRVVSRVDDSTGIERQFEYE